MRKVLSSPTLAYHDADKQRLRLLISCIYLRPEFHKSTDERDLAIGALRLKTALVSNACAKSCSGICVLITDYKWLFEVMAESFFSSVYRWLPVVEEASFNAALNDPQLHQSPYSTTLVLAVCLLSRQVSVGELAPIREDLYDAAKRSFWGLQPVTSAHPAAIQAGLLLSTYEYGHGLLRNAYITITTSTAIARISGIGDFAYVTGHGNVNEHSYKVLWASIILER